MRLRRSLVTALFCCVLLGGACAKGSGNSDSDAGTNCNDKNDCRPGYDCVGGECVPEGNNNNNNSNCDGHPIIEVSPGTLVFDEAVVGAPQTLPVTITNIGTCNLQLNDVRVEETDAVEEFSVGSPPLWVLGPGDTVQLNVTLDPTDSLLDSGSLIIESNDEVSPVVAVELTSAWIGSPDLSVCVLTGQPAPDECADPMVIDFGTVPYAGTAYAEVALSNVGTGNKVISVETLVVDTVATSHDPLYQIELFRKVENPPGSGTWEETPVTLPVDIAPTTGGEPDPLALYARVTFTANTDGFLILTGDSLHLTTTDTDNPSPADTVIPISATIDGCPPGLHNLNGNTTDGCEYACSVTNGGVEQCDGVDNDCDGIVDSHTEACYDNADNGCDSDGSNCVGICAAGTRTCTNSVWGSCEGQTVGVSELCNDLDDDCDGTVNNDLDEGGSACGATSSIPRDNRPENGSTDTITGTITGSDEDWYRITFEDNHITSSADTFNVQIRFTDPPNGGAFRMDIMQDGCSMGPVCGSGPSVGITEFTWAALGDNPRNNVGTTPSGTTYTGSTCASGTTPCTNNTMTLYIRVYRTTSTICESYTITASNN